MKIYKAISNKKDIKPYFFGANRDVVYTFEGLVMACYTNYKEGLFEFQSGKILYFIMNELRQKAIGKAVRDILKKDIPLSDKYVAFLLLSPLMNGRVNEAYIQQVTSWDSKQENEKYKLLGDMAFNNGRYAICLEHYKRAQFISYDELVDNNIGATYLRLHSYDKAYGYFEKAMKYSDHISIKVNLIKGYKMEKRYDEALKLIFEYLKETYTWELLMEAGDIFIKQGDYNQAISLFLNAYEQNKDDMILCKIIRARIKGDQFDAASKEIELLYERDKESYYLLKSRILIQEAKTNEAIDLLEKACIIVEDSQKIHFELARLYRQNNRIINAIKNISEVDRLSDKNNDEVLFEMALIAKEAGNHKDYKEKLNQLILITEGNIRKRLGYN